MKKYFFFAIIALLVSFVELFASEPLWPTHAVKAVKTFSVDEKQWDIVTAEPDTFEYYGKWYVKSWGYGVAHKNGQIIVPLLFDSSEDIQYVYAAPRIFFICIDKKGERQMVYCYREESDEKQTHLFDISTKDDTVEIQGIYNIGREKESIKDEFLYSFFLFESQKKGKGVYYVDWNAEHIFELGELILYPSKEYKDIQICSSTFNSKYRSRGGWLAMYDKVQRIKQIYYSIDYTTDNQTYHKRFLNKEPYIASSTIKEADKQTWEEYSSCCEIVQKELAARGYVDIIEQYVRQKLFGTYGSFSEFFVNDISDKKVENVLPLINLAATKDTRLLYYMACMLAGHETEWIYDDDYNEVPPTEPKNYSYKDKNLAQQFFLIYLKKSKIKMDDNNQNTPFGLSAEEVFNKIYRAFPELKGKINDTFLQSVDASDKRILQLLEQVKKLKKSDHEKLIHEDVKNAVPTFGLG